MAEQKLHMKIGGLACSFCAESINKAFRREDSVKNVNVSLAHEEVNIQYDDNLVDEPELQQIILDLGYTIRDPDKTKAFEEQQRELAVHRRRLLIASGFAALALAVMGAMWSGVMRSWFPYVMMVLALATVFGPGGYIVKKAYQSLRRGVLNQHVLLEFGAFSGLAGGFAGLFYPAFPAAEFFGVSVFIATYHILSGWSANKVRVRASRAVRKLLDLQPDTARRIDEEGQEQEVEVSSSAAIGSASGPARRSPSTAVLWKAPRAWTRASSPANRFLPRKARATRWSAAPSTRRVRLLLR